MRFNTELLNTYISLMEKFYTVYYHTNHYGGMSYPLLTSSDRLSRYIGLTLDRYAPVCSQTRTVYIVAKLLDKIKVVIFRTPTFGSTERWETPVELLTSTH